MVTERAPSIPSATGGEVKQIQEFYQAPGHALPFSILRFLPKFAISSAHPRALSTALYPWTLSRLIRGQCGAQVFFCLAFPAPIQHLVTGSLWKVSSRSDQLGGTCGLHGCLRDKADTLQDRASRKQGATKPTDSSPGPVPRRKTEASKD